MDWFLSRADRSSKLTAHTLHNPEQLAERNKQQFLLEQKLVLKHNTFTLQAENQLMIQYATS